MKHKKPFTILYGLGIILALTAAFLMWFDVLPTASRVVILLVGISLILTAVPIAKAKKSK